MNKTLRTILIVFVSLVVAAGLFLGGFFLSRTLVNDRVAYGFMMNRCNQRNDDGRGNLPGPGGMMQGGHRGQGFGMMDGFGYTARADVEPLTIDEARTAAESYLSDLGNDDLQISEIMVFDNNAYVSVSEKSTGIGAFELLVNPLTKTAFPEQGPNHMWNLKYGMQDGMCRRMGSCPQVSVTFNDITTEMTVTADRAIQYAQDYLDQLGSGLTAGGEAQQFYGYYTIDTLKDGEIAGMLSVNGYNGQVWLHSWHGNFIEADEVE